MRLTPEQIRQALQHDEDVRQLCLDYFTGMFCRDESVMTIVTQVVDARGADAFKDVYFLRDLAQTDATIEWMIRRLRQLPEPFDDEVDQADAEDDFDEDDFEDVENIDDVDLLHNVLLAAPGVLLQRHRDDVLSVLPPCYQTRVIRRLGLLSESPSDLWNRLEALTSETPLDEDEEFPIEEVDDLIVTLAELGMVPIDRMMELLRLDLSDIYDSPLYMLQPCLIKLAGLIRHEPVLPILVESLRSEEEFVCDEARDAIVRLGTDEVVRTIVELFPEEDWTWQTLAGFALGEIHSDESIRSQIELLQSDMLDPDGCRFIVQGLVRQFSTEGLEAIAQYLDSRRDWCSDSDWTDTLQEMHAAARLLDFDLPRMDDWLSKAREEPFDYGFDESDDLGDAPRFSDVPRNEPPPPRVTVIHDGPRVDRNDPCPCGSGRKFKKCCMGKEDLD